MECNNKVISSESDHHNSFEIMGDNYAIENCILYEYNMHADKLSPSYTEHNNEEYAFCEQITKTTTTTAYKWNL